MKTKTLIRNKAYSVNDAYAMGFTPLASPLYYFKDSKYFEKQKVLLHNRYAIPGTIHWSDESTNAFTSEEVIQARNIHRKENLKETIIVKRWFSFNDDEANGYFYTIFEKEFHLF